MIEEEEEVAVILAVVDSRMVNVSETVTGIKIVGLTAVMAMVIAEDLEETGMVMETRIGFSADVVVTETGILEAEVVLVHVEPTGLDPITTEKVVADLEAEMMDFLQKEVLTSAR
jgi:myo-inositol catabolism protein IolC